MIATAHRIGIVLVCLAWSSSSWTAVGQEGAQANRLTLEVQKEIATQLRSNDFEVQLEGIQRTSKLRQEGVKLLDDLIALLPSKNNDVANQAALVIGAMGPIAIRAAPALVANMLDDKAKTVDQEFLWISFSRALFGLGPKVIPVLVDSIESSNHAQFAGICGALHDFGTAAKPGLKKLIAKGESDEQDRWPALFVMEAIGQPSIEAMPLLLDSLAHENFQFQLIACRVLTIIGPPAKEAKPLLYRLTKDGNVSARGRAAIALGAIGTSDGDREKLLETMAQLLADPNQVVRERAVIGIGYLKQDAKSLTETVRKAMTNPNFSAKCEACVALWRISGVAKESVEQLVVLMEKIDYDLTAIASLGEIGPDAIDALPAILKKMESEDLSYALEGCNTISKMGLAAKAALPKLIELCDSEDPEVRIAAKAAREELERP